MAQGDILSATVHRWYIELLVEGLSSGGTYNTGYGTDNNPADANLIITRTNETFSGAAIATTKQTTVYVTKVKRQDVPNQTTPDETISGSNVIIRLALSEEIYAGDTNITVTIASGLYTQGGVPTNSVTALSVTNSSTRAYYPCIANFSRLFHGRIMGFDDINMAEESTNFEVRVTAYHRDGVVPVVKVTATGQTSSHVETIYLTQSDEVVEQSKYNDYYPVPERIGNIPISGFTQGELVDLNLVPYPNIGNATVLRDSSLTGHSMPTHSLATQTVVCDKNHTYGITVANIDSVLGDNGTGVVVDFGSFDPQSPPAPFADMGAAATAIRAYNLANHSRDNHSGGIFFLQAGDHSMTTTSTLGTVGDAFVIISPFPGVERSSVNLINQNDWIADKTHYHNLTIDIPVGSTLWSNNLDYQWWSECDIDGFPAYHCYRSGALAVFTGNDISDCPQRFRYSGVGPCNHILIGNNIHDFSVDVLIMSGLLRGNYLEGNVNSTDGYSSQPIKGIICDYNRVKKIGDSSAAFSFGSDIVGDNLEGNVFVNNIVEKPTTGSTGIVGMAADGTGQYRIENFIILHNTLLGNRANLAYNDYTLEGVGPAPREGWVIKNNSFEDLNIVGDTSYHGGVPSSDKNGNLSLMHGCGISGNYYSDQPVAGYMPEFIGLKSILDVGGDPGFVDNAGGFGSGLGDGDYHLQSDSVLIGLCVDSFLKYDSDGALRHVPDESGAYSFSSGFVSMCDMNGGMYSMVGGF